MKSVIQDVAAFHVACDVPIVDRPTIQSERVKQLRHRLVEEEFIELVDAMNDEDIVEIADAIADLIYVAVGTALAYGIPLEAVWNEVQRSNMAKADPVTGKVVKREDGKVLKPEGWTPPEIASILNAAA